MTVRRLWSWLAVCLVLAALFAPLVANDLPLVAEDPAAGLRFPAVADWLGAEVPPPAGHTWATWTARQEDDSVHTCIRTPWPHGPERVDTRRIDTAPSWAHPMGCDDLGRDVLSRVLHGARSALLVGILSAVIAMAAGLLLGGLAGMRGGLADALVLGLVELFLCFPALFLALVAGSLFGPSTTALVCVVAAVSWPVFARMVRAELLAMRNADFVLAARGLGVGNARLFWHHMLPQLRSQLAVTFVLVVAQAVVVESTLTFLGLGGNRASWGAILAQGRDGAHLGKWHLWLFPALAVSVTVLCCHALAARAASRVR